MMKERLVSIIAAAALCMNAAGQHKAYTTMYDWKPMAEEITQGADGTWDNRKGVCQGYCELFYRLAEALGIESVIITGETKDNDNSLSEKEHTWILADSGLG